MDKILQPAKLNLDVNLSADGGNGTRFTHWKTQMTHYIDSIKTTANTEELQYNVLINVISSEIFPHVSSCTKYKDAMTILEGLFVKTKNANYARHCLTTRKQRDGESVEQFLIALDTSSKDCAFEEVTAEVYRSECIRTAFIAGLKSNHIRQRLLEETKPLADTIKAAATYEQALRNNERYQAAGHLAACTVNEPYSELQQMQSPPPSPAPDQLSQAQLSAMFQPNQPRNDKGGNCQYCGFGRHPRNRCPAREAACNLCSKKGHYARMCRSYSKQGQNQKKTSAAIPSVEDPGNLFVPTYHYHPHTSSLL